MGTKLKYDAIMVVYFINEETRKTAFFFKFRYDYSSGFWSNMFASDIHSSRYVISFYYLMSVHNYKIHI